MRVTSALPPGEWCSGYCACDNLDHSSRLILHNDKLQLRFEVVLLPQTIHTGNVLIATLGEANDRGTRGAPARTVRSLDVLFHVVLEGGKLGHVHGGQLGTPFGNRATHAQTLAMFQDEIRTDAEHSRNQCKCCAGQIGT